MFMSEAGHILYLRILYPIHIQAQKKDIISYHYRGKKKNMDIYPIFQAQKKDIISYHYRGKKKDMDIYPISFTKTLPVS
jgi:hypothetical protein